MRPSKAQTDALIQLLLAAGWTTEGATIFAPQRRMWLQIDDPWTGDIVDMADRMAARLARIRRFESEHRAGHDTDTDTDTESLVNALNSIVNTISADRLRWGLWRRDPGDRTPNSTKLLREFDTESRAIESLNHQEKLRDGLLYWIQKRCIDVLP